LRKVFYAFPMSTANLHSTPIDIVGMMSYFIYAPATFFAEYRCPDTGCVTYMYLQATRNYVLPLLGLTDILTAASLLSNARTSSS